MTRHAYFPPGAEEPTHIFDSYESTMRHAQDQGDPTPLTRPVTIGTLESPTQDDIVDWVVSALTSANPTWERGWDEYMIRLTDHIEFAAARLASTITRFMEQTPGYVVDDRDLEHLKDMGIPVAGTPDYATDEEE